MKVDVDLNKIEFSRLTLSEAATILDNEPNAKIVADWLRELYLTRQAIYAIQSETAKVSR